jgi:predicted benzoate:H+ symporter BenE
MDVNLFRLSFIETGAVSPAMLKDFSPQAAFMGLLVAFVGFASSFAVVLQGLKGVGATDYEAASGLMALSVAMGICGIVLSVWTKLPETRPAECPPSP